MVEKIEDINLPASIVGRLIKDALPPGASVSKEARNALTRASSVFILFLTSSSTEAAHEKKHKTISAQHVLTALQEIDFENFVEPLKQQLESFRKTIKDKKDKKNSEVTPLANEGEAIEVDDDVNETIEVDEDMADGPS